MLSQEATDWQDIFQQWVEDEGEEAYDWDNAYDILSDLANHPLNLNQASRAELEAIPMLSVQQVADILEHRERYRRIYSWNEMLAIPSLSVQLLRVLRPFIFLGQPAAKPVRPLRLDSIFLHGKHEVNLTTSVPFYKRKGFRNDDYLGFPYGHTLRYRLRYRNRVTLGLTGGQDEGEPFLASKNQLGYDHYSIYAQINDLGSFSRICLGTYRVQMGMGLLMNGAFLLGKTPDLQQANRSSAVVRSSASRSSADYLLGVAASANLSSHWKLTSFISYRPQDATLNKDSTVATLLSSGYHRTAKEMEKKGNTHLLDAGASIGWHKSTLFVNGNMVFTHLDRRLSPNTSAAYRKHDPQGYDFLNASVDYGFTNSRISLAGETAINQLGALAAIHRGSWRPSRTMTLTLIHRYYDTRYTALHARSFSEGSSVRNEHGVYLGMSWDTQGAGYYTWYADYAHFAEPRYMVSLPSDAFDTMVTGKWEKENWTLDSRYRLHIKQRDNKDHTILQNRIEQRARMRYSVCLSQNWSLQTQADGTYVSMLDGKQWGYMVGQQASWKDDFFQLAGRIGYFRTTDYESRIYQYEPSLLYDFGFPTYNGEGIRYSLTFKAIVSQRLILMAKMGVTDYFDRPVIGTGQQQIARSSKTDLDLQIRWKF